MDSTTHSSRGVPVATFVNYAEAGDSFQYVEDVALKEKRFMVVYNMNVNGNDVRNAWSEGRFSYAPGEKTPATLSDFTHVRCLTLESPPAWARPSFRDTMERNRWVSLQDFFNRNGYADEDAAAYRMKNMAADQVFCRGDFALQFKKQLRIRIPRKRTASEEEKVADNKLRKKIYITP
jgi:hypothetical protein